MRIIEGRCGRRGTNRLEMNFRDIELPDPTEPRQFVVLGDVAVGRQCGDQGKGKTLQIMLGWRDGGPGRHTLTFADGRVVTVVVDKAGTVLEDADGTSLAQIAAELPAVVRDAGGDVVFSVTGPGEQDTAVRQLTVLDRTGAPMARLEVSYDDHSWRQISVARDVARAAVSVGEELRSLTGSGSTALKMKVAGTRLHLDAPVSDEDLTVLLGMCVDIGIGYRRYLESLRKL